jgi:Phthiocerol/phthiodiolone dimycocerosyl transferase C-terminus
MDHNEHYEQKIAYARASLWAPFYTVGMAARIRGDLPAGLLEAALHKLQTLYPPLASRVRVEKDGTAWLTTEGVEEFTLEVRTRSSDDDWAKTFLEQERLPFAFGCGPVARFFLLRGDQVSDLVAIVPHVICDGYSMTYVMNDIVALLNDPNQVVRRPLPPPPVTWQNVQHSVHDNLLLRGLARVVSRLWLGKRVVLHQDEYEALHQSYWERQQNGVLVFGLSAAETSDLSARCRQHSVSITGALMAAFLLAQVEVQPAAQPPRYEITVSANIRDRLVQPPGRVVGVYASVIDLTMRSKSGTSFWELARDGHVRIHKLLKDRSQIYRPLVLNELDPSIADSFITALSTDQWSPELRLLSRFARIKGDARCLNISNIGRIELPKLDAPYHLETILPFPPIVPGGGMALNVLTVDGKMNIILKFRLNELDCDAATNIRDRALNYLSGA